MIGRRNATLAELERVLDWAADEGWNPGLDDAAAFFAADPEGFFVAEDDGDIVGAISVVNHNPAFAFLGLYLVRPSLRGRGIGLALWDFALRHAGNRLVGLDGVPDQQSNYAVSGFVHAGATTRFSGHIPPLADPAVELAEPRDVSRLIALEASCSGQMKSAYLTAWFQQTDRRKTIVFRERNEVAGFCTVRQCRDGVKIGPLYASDTTVARCLMRHAATLWSADIVIDVPGGAALLDELCRDFGLVPGFETARMYRGAFRAAEAPIFAVASLELG